MTAGGWAMFLCSWAFIIGLAAFSMNRVLRLRQRDMERIHPLLDIDTQDTEESRTAP
ncbi:MAG: hypothetical protein HY804_14260 [Nitrospinae bacterium]|nr:hypothetical protein [Nitrospinota bacterium]